MKYIDAERLRAEIERLQRAAAITMEELQMDEPSEGMRGELDAYDDILWFIDSLQQDQPEVDLEKEYQEFCKDYPFPWSSQYVNREYIDELCLSIARHFYELGLKAKEE